MIKLVKKIAKFSNNISYNICKKYTKHYYEKIGIPYRAAILVVIAMEDFFAERNVRVEDSDSIIEILIATYLIDKVEWDRTKKCLDEIKTALDFDAN